MSGQKIQSITTTIQIIRRETIFPIMCEHLWEDFDSFFSSRHFVFFWSTISKIIQYLPSHSQTKTLGWYWYFVLSFCYGKECGNWVPWVPSISKKIAFWCPVLWNPTFFLPLLTHMETNKLVPNFLNKPEE